MGPKMTRLHSEQLTRNGRPVVGLAEVSAPPTAPPTSPWALAVGSSIVAAAAGWVIEEVASNVRGKRRRRR